MGPKVAERLQCLQIYTVQDLLFHLPIRYQDRTRIRPVGALRAGEECVVIGTIEHSEVVFRKRRMLLISVEDGTGRVLLRFFYFNKSQRSSLSSGVKIRCFGEIRRGLKGPEMVHPEYEILLQDEPAKVEDHLTPIYPTTEGLHQLSLRRLTSQALQWSSQHDEPRLDLLPHLPRIDGQNISILDALKFVHRPPPEADTESLMAGKHPMQRRLAFEELLAQQLSLSKLRLQMQKQDAIPIQSEGKLYSRLINGLEFKLTRSQKKVIKTIFSDLANDFPMLRLVQGDVGSGKTLVALAGCLQAIEAGYQAVMMAPTEILAEQHLRNFSLWLEPLGVRLAWLSEKLTTSKANEMKE
ncbi:MAG: DEAD/DEAH box helicase, partial [Gammaproteobacteria bacterium]